MWVTTKFLLVLYIFFNTLFIFKWGYNPDSLSLDNILLHISSLLMLIAYSESLNNFVHGKWKRIFIGFFLILFYLAGAKYRYRVRTSFDYALLYDNFLEAFNEEALGIVQNTLKPKDFLQILGLLPVLLFVELKYKSFSIIKNRSKSKISIFSIIFIVLIVSTPLPYGEVSYFISSAWNFHFSKMPKSLNYAKITNENLFFKEISSKYHETTPNIILINIESFNSTFINKKTKEGVEVTPFFNSLIKEGVYIEDFYGNSIQTIKGMYAILCSKIPFIRGKAAYDFKSLSSITCLPQLLQTYGYQTLFHDGFPDLKFDNTYNFMNTIGFSKIMATSTKNLSNEEKNSKVWGWGPEDSVSYEQFLKAIQNLNKEKPYFAMIHTISNHMKFNKVPKSESKLFSENVKGDKEKMYMNSLNASDRYMGKFIEDLKHNKIFDDTLIIITGDHSFPAGEHGIYDNFVSYYQEFFKTPLLIIWKNKLSPQIIEKKTYSHVDILPTIVDLIGKNGRIETMGRSIFSDEDSYALLVQPYSGIYLSVVNYPYKYVWDRRKNKDYLYNIELDPLESQKLVDQEQINKLKPKIDEIIFSFESYYKK